MRDFIRDFKARFRRRRMEKHLVGVPSPVPCPKCGRGYLVPLLVPHFKSKDPMGENREFSHYELYWKCSGMGCTYEVKG
ncbi:MAG: hypothetical protein ABSG74_12590 [Candidatus Bathyarchaeia archaeon]